MMPDQVYDSSEPSNGPSTTPESARSLVSETVLGEIAGSAPKTPAESGAKPSTQGNESSTQNLSSYLNTNFSIIDANKPSATTQTEQPNASSPGTKSPEPGTSPVQQPGETSSKPNPRPEETAKPGDSSGNKPTKAEDTKGSESVLGTSQLPQQTAGETGLLPGVSKPPVRTEDSGRTGSDTGLLPTVSKSSIRTEDTTRTDTRHSEQPTIANPTTGKPDVEHKEVTSGRPSSTSSSPISDLVSHAENLVGQFVPKPTSLEQSRPSDESKTPPTGARSSGVSGMIESVRNTIDPTGVLPRIIHNIVDDRKETTPSSPAAEPGRARPQADSTVKPGESGPDRRETTGSFFGETVLGSVFGHDSRVPTVLKPNGEPSPESGKTPKPSEERREVTSSSSPVGSLPHVQLADSKPESSPSTTPSANNGWLSTMFSHAQPDKARLDDPLKETVKDTINTIRHSAEVAQDNVLRSGNKPEDRKETVTQGGAGENPVNRGLISQMQDQLSRVLRFAEERKEVTSARENIVRASEGVVGGASPDSPGKPSKPLPLEENRPGILRDTIDTFMGSKPGQNSDNVVRTPGKPSDDAKDQSFFQRALADINRTIGPSAELTSSSRLPESKTQPQLLEQLSRVVSEPFRQTRPSTDEIKELGSIPRTPADGRLQVVDQLSRPGKPTDELRELISNQRPVDGRQSSPPSDAITKIFNDQKDLVSTIRPTTGGDDLRPRVSQLAELATNQTAGDNRNIRPGELLRDTTQITRDMLTHVLASLEPPTNKPQVSKDGDQLIVKKDQPAEFRVVDIVTRRPETTANNDNDRRSEINTRTGDASLAKTSDLISGRAAEFVAALRNIEAVIARNNEVIGVRTTEITGVKATEAASARIADVTGVKPADVTGKIAEVGGGKVTEVAGAKAIEVSGPKAIEIAGARAIEIAGIKAMELGGAKPTEVGAVKTAEVPGLKTTEFPGARGIDPVAGRTAEAGGKPTEIGTSRNAEVGNVKNADVVSGKAVDTIGVRSDSTGGRTADVPGTRDASGRVIQTIDPTGLGQTTSDSQKPIASNNNDPKNKDNSEATTKPGQNGQPVAHDNPLIIFNSPKDKNGKPEDGAKAEEDAKSRSNNPLMTGTTTNQQNNNNGQNNNGQNNNTQAQDPNAPPMQPIALPSLEISDGNDKKRMASLRQRIMSARRGFGEHERATNRTFDWKKRQLAMVDFKKNNSTPDGQEPEQSEQSGSEDSRELVTVSAIKHYVGSIPLRNRQSQSDTTD